MEGIWKNLLVALLDVFRHQIKQLRALVNADFTTVIETQAPSPLFNAKSLVDELNEIHNYAGQFHHDTNPGSADSVLIADSEIKTLIGLWKMFTKEFSFTAPMCH